MAQGEPVQRVRISRSAGSSDEAHLDDEGAEARQDDCGGDGAARGKAQGRRCQAVRDGGDGRPAAGDKGGWTDVGLTSMTVKSP